MAVGIGRTERELPDWEPKSIGEQTGILLGLLGWKHQRDTVGNLLLHGFHSGSGGVPGHRSGVSKTEVGEVVVVNILKPTTLCTFHIKREGPWPLLHPDHRDATQ